MKSYSHKRCVVHETMVRNAPQPKGNVIHMAETKTTTGKELVNVEMLQYFKTKEDALVKSWDAQVLKDAKDYTDAEVKKVSDAESALEARVTTAEGKITTLIGDDADKSVRTIANEELAAQLIPEGAKEALDTLQEIAAWIQSHPDDASAMNKAIEDLTKLVGTLPEGVTATTIAGYVAELVSAEQTRAEGAEGDLSDRLDVIEEAMGDTGSIADAIATAKSEAIASAKDYSDGLNTAMDTRVTAVETLSAANKTAIDSINNAETGILKAAKDYADGLDTATNLKVTANANAIAAINDETTGAVATSEAYTDSAIAALSTAGGAIKAVVDDLSTYETATDARLDSLEAVTGSIATIPDIDSIFGTDAE